MKTGGKNSEKAASAPASEGGLRSLLERDAATVDCNFGPYPGLRPYQRHEAEVFFGRDQQISAIVDQLASSQFIAVTGPSGSGKSSLLRAGVIPKLEQGHHGGLGDRWTTIITAPGQSPMRHLCEALESIVVSKSETRPNVRSILGSSKTGLIRLIEDYVPSHKGRVLLLVDQFEELFRYKSRGGYAEAARYVNLLLSVLNATATRLFVVITMRTDFLGDCTKFEGLPEAINENVYLTPRLFGDELREAITKPAEFFGAKVEPETCRVILHDVKRLSSSQLSGSSTSDKAEANLNAEHDHLPLMQHTLMRMWEHSGNTLDPDGHNSHANRSLTIDDYKRVGGIRGALNQHAEEVYEHLSWSASSDENKAAIDKIDDFESDYAKSRKCVCQFVFQRLTFRDSGHKDVRNPATAQELMHVAGLASLADLEPVMARFADETCSFIRYDTETFEKETTVDIGHEALIRNWNRLKQWVDQEAALKDAYFKVSHERSRHRKTRPHWISQFWLNEYGPLIGALEKRDAHAANEGIAKRFMPSLVWANRYRDEFARAKIKYHSFETVRQFVADSEQHWLEEDRERIKRLENNERLKQELEFKEKESHFLLERNSLQEKQLAVEKSQKQAFSERAQYQKKYNYSLFALLFVTIVGGYFYLNQQLVTRSLEKQIERLSTMSVKFSEYHHKHDAKFSRKLRTYIEALDSSGDWFHENILNPMMRITLVSDIENQRKEYIDGWLKHRDDAMSSMGDEHAEFDKDHFMEIPNENFMALVGEMDQSSASILTKIQSELAAIPIPMREPISGKFSQFDVSEDASVVVLAYDSSKGQLPTLILKHFDNYTVLHENELRVNWDDLGLESGKWGVQIRDIKISPNGRLLYALFDASNEEIGKKVITVFDVDKRQKRVSLELGSKFRDKLNLAWSSDSNILVGVSGEGRFFYCSIKHCDFPIQDDFESSKIETNISHDYGVETLSLLDMVGSGEGSVIAVFASNMHNRLTAYNFIIDEGMNDIGTLSYQQSVKELTLQVNRGFRADKVLYCEASDTLMAYDEQVEIAHAWPLTSNGNLQLSDACSLKFVRHSGRGKFDVRIWKFPTDPSRWNKIAAKTHNSSSQNRGELREPLSAEFEGFTDQVARFEFPHILDHQLLLNNRGDTLFTVSRGIHETSDDFLVSSQDTISSMNAWYVNNIYHVAHAQELVLKKTDSVGIDLENNSVLVHSDGALPDQVVVLPISIGTDQMDNVYTFDLESREFVRRQNGRSTALRSTKLGDSIGDFEVTSDEGEHTSLAYAVPNGFSATINRKSNTPFQLTDQRYMFHSPDAQSGIVMIPVTGTQQVGTGSSKSVTTHGLEVWVPMPGGAGTIAPPQNPTARIGFPSSVVWATTLPGSNHLIVQTEKHGVLVTVWKHAELMLELCKRLRVFPPRKRHHLVEMQTETGVKSIVENCSNWSN